MEMKIAGACALMLAAGLALSSPAQAQETVTIGALLPLTGTAAGFGQSAQEGLAAWAEEANRRPGVAFKVVVVDNRGQTQDAVSGYARLKGLEGAPVIASSLSSPTLAIMPRANEDKVVIFNGGNGAALLDAGPYFFSNVLNLFISADVIAGYAHEKLGVHSVATLFRTDDYGDGGRRRFEAVWQELGGTLVASESFAPGTLDLRSQISKIVASGADAVFMLGFGEELASAVNELARQQYKGVMLGDSGFGQPEITRLAADAAEGRAFFSLEDWNPASPPNEEAARFVEAVRARTGAAPNINHVRYYETGQVIEQAVRRILEGGGAVSGEALKAAIESIGTIEGVSGPVVFSPDNHFAAKRLAIRTVKGGQFATVEVLTAEDVARYSNP